MPPKKTPTAVLKNRGSWRAKTRPDEPQARGEPEPPGWLTDAARSVWERLTPQLVGMGVAGEIDSWALARYCELAADYLECGEFIRRFGYVGDDGREYPQVRRQAKLADQLLVMEREFGMTPRARASLLVAEPATPKDPDSPLKSRLHT